MFHEDAAAGRSQRHCNAIYGALHRASALRDHLHMTRSALAGWKKGLPCKQALQLSRSMVVTLSGQLFHEQQNDAARCILVLCGGMLESNKEWQQKPLTLHLKAMRGLWKVVIKPLEY